MPFPFSFPCFFLFLFISPSSFFIQQTQIKKMAQYSPMVMASTGAIDTTDQWYFTKDDVRHTPSIAGSDYLTPNGSNNKLVSQAEEIQWRWRSGNFISNVAKKLDM